MRTISVDVDIDMEDIDTDDLVQELCTRLKRTNGRKSLTNKEKAELKESLSDINESLALAPVRSIEVKTLEDKMKYEHILNVWNKYTSEQIEKLIP